MGSRPTLLRDVGMIGLVYGSALLAVVAFFALLFEVVVGGVGQLSLAFLTTGPQDAGRAGGILPIIASTAMLLGVALGVTLPLGLGAAVYLTEFTSGKPASAIRMSLDVLAGVPSIVFGLFGNALFCVALGMGFSILSGGLTLACMMLPLFIRTTEAGLSAVPLDWRRGAAALGLSQWTALRSVLLPAAAPVIGAGLMLSVGRALAETAALIFTSGYVDRMPDSIGSSGRALSVHIYDLSMNVTGGDPNAYASALILIMTLLTISLTASIGTDRLLARRITTS